ncbi:hypothetical protein MCW82_15835 [Azospirillum doebereinerae]|nr:hypothetical protein [Azospirillum doebereinerae]
MAIFSPITKNAQASPPSSWKPVASSIADNGFAAAKSKPTADDSVSVGKLGQALKGVAAEAFNHLDKKAKGFLENLVKSGAVSAEDVALGLRSAASEATFSRYVAERPQDSEDKQRLNAANAASERIRGYGDRLGEARVAFGTARDALHKEQGSGAISEADVQEKLAPLQKQFDDSFAALDRDYSPEQRQADLAQGDDGGFAKNLNGFAQAVSANMGEDGFVSPNSMEGKAAGEKLFKLGFQPEMFGKAFKNFADTVDLPGIGRKASPQAATPASSPEEAVPLPRQGSAPAVKGGTPGAAPGADVTGLDPGKAKAAISMLQTALDLNAKSNKTSAVAVSAASREADANLTSLMDALKNGISPSSPSVKIDT